MSSQSCTSRSASRWSTGLIALALIAGACGNETATEDRSVASLSNDADSEGSVTNELASDTEPPTEAEMEEAELRFNQCLDELGVSVGIAAEVEGEDIADDEASENQELDTDADPQKLKVAIEECDQHLTDVFGEFAPSPEEEAQLQDAEAVFETCMADNGLDISSGDDTGTGLNLGSGEDTEAEQILDDCAQKAFGDFEEVGP